MEKKKSSKERVFSKRPVNWKKAMNLFKKRRRHIIRENIGNPPL